MVSIECTLHGSLEDSLPSDHTQNHISLSFNTPPDVDTLLNALKIDRENLQFVLGDGKYIEIEDWGKPITSKSIQLWPRMSGG